MLFKIFRHKYAFPAAVLLFGIICYQAAFKKTLAAWHLNRQLAREAGQATGLGTPTGYLVRKQQNLQHLVDHYSADSTAFRSAIIARTAEIAEKNRVLVRSVPPEDPALQTAQTAVEKVIFNGDYFRLLRALQELEQAIDLGIVRSLRFDVPRAGSQPNEKTLEMSVYLQVIKK